MCSFLTSCASPSPSRKEGCQDNVYFYTISIIQTCLRNITGACPSMCHHVCSVLLLLLFFFSVFDFKLNLGRWCLCSPGWMCLFIYQWTFTTFVRLQFSAFVTLQKNTVLLPWQPMGWGDVGGDVNGCGRMEGGWVMQKTVIRCRSNA